MANAAIAVTNLADAGTLTASTSASLMPVSRLQNQHVRKRWRSTAAPAYVICDLGFSASIDTIALLGMTAVAGASAQVRASASNPAVTGSLSFDSGTIDDGDPEFSTTHGALVYLRSSPVTTRYVRIDVTDASAAYVEAGRLFIGLREAFTYNFAPGARRGWIDRSRLETTAGGQTLVFPDDKVRTEEINFEWIPESQRNGVWETMGRVNGNSKDVLLILDTASGNLPRDSIFGLITSPPGSTVYTTIPELFSAPLAVKERL